MRGKCNNRGALTQRHLGFLELKSIYEPEGNFILIQRCQPPLCGSSEHKIEEGSDCHLGLVGSSALVEPQHLSL